MIQGDIVNIGGLVTKKPVTLLRYKLHAGYLSQV